MTRGFSAIGLHTPKTRINIGSVLRAAACYESALVAVSGSRYSHQVTDTTKAWRHFPLLLVDDLRDAVPFDTIPVAVDLVDRAIELQDYHHPERAFYVFGPEDGTLDDSVLNWCRHRIVVPTNHCMNLAATVNVVLYDRLAKQRRAA